MSETCSFEGGWSPRYLKQPASRPSGVARVRRLAPETRSSGPRRCKARRSNTTAASFAGSSSSYARPCGTRCGGQGRRKIKAAKFSSGVLFVKSEEPLNPPTIVATLACTIDTSRALASSRASTAHAYWFHSWPASWRVAKLNDASYLTVLVGDGGAGVAASRWTCIVVFISTNELPLTKGHSILTPCAHELSWPQTWEQIGRLFLPREHSFL